MIEQQLDGLSDADRRVLEAASVAGMGCSAAAVAAGVEGTMEAVEEQCARLARHGQSLEADGVEEWPDGTVAGRYRFRHALCQEVVYERLTAPRCLRLFYLGRGALLLAQGDPEHTTTGACVEEAVACLQQALVLARQRQARALELRAATSLARLWHQQGRRVEARAVLAPVYGWFTEGFVTVDLQEARTLLRDLGEQLPRIC